MTATQGEHTAPMPVCQQSAMIHTLAALALLGIAEPPVGGEQPAPLDWRQLEAGALANPHQLTQRELYIKAGEAYFSPDDRWVIFQAIEPPVAGKEADPFYAMFVAPVNFNAEGTEMTGLGQAIRVSAPDTANTCGWFDPVRQGRVIFGSTLTRPADEQKSGFQVGSRRYVWMFPAEMEVVQRGVVPMLEIDTKEGGIASTSAEASAAIAWQLEQLKKSLSAPAPADAVSGFSPGRMKARLTAELLDLDLKRVEELAAFEKLATPVFSRPNYDAECSYSNDGRFILYAHVEPTKAGEKANADIYVYDTLTQKHQPIIVGPGYDGGPFFSPDNKRICYRSDRKGDDLLQLFIADLKFENGVPVGIEREYQLTDNGAVNWAPFFHPSSEFLVYGSSAVSHSNYEIFAIKLEKEKLEAAAKASGPGTIHVTDLSTVRLTHADGADVLPVFSHDGRFMMWTSQRGPRVAGEERPSSQLWAARWLGLPAK
jgi:hypothetical protein